MGSEVIIIPIIFGVLFGLYYLFISARNKERLALIEKGADASIFFSNKRGSHGTSKILILNLALLSMGIGAGIFFGGLFHEVLGMSEEIAFPGSIFFMAGAGLLSGFFMTKRLVTKD
ncbi:MULTISPECIES: DUF6249 domain-containing protein [Gilvibacter]|uniref:DUF6249 domain-containing protein n=1 Tax=Gilvibacter TaxID=379070 RepID=UPI0023501FB1|nr:MULTISPECIES: DUF6249 domain-containing protein [Gilvibacter]MDC7999291.1 hypothetical protein [Gilvibacter sediminis]NQX78702.1 hypothetical protein [Gilvibacter sp.]